MSNTVVSVQTPTVLGSWKEIAAYLGKGVRTVQRWEQQFGLPVRRPNGRPERIVYATREELDRWLRTEWAERAKSAALFEMTTTETDRLSFSRATIQTSRELLDSSRKLRASLSRTADALRQQCQTMGHSLNALGAFPPCEGTSPQQNSRS